MAVIGVGVEGDVADECDVGVFALEQAGGAADQVFRICGLGAFGVASVR